MLEDLRGQPLCERAGSPVAIHQPAPVAGMLVCRFATSAEFYVAWFGEAGRKAGAGNFVYWHAALEARRRGCLRLDLGGYCPSGETEAGLRHFKKGLRGE